MDSDVSGQSVGPIFKGQEVFLDFLILEDGTDKTSWPLKMVPIGCPETSVHNYHSTLRNIPEERRSQMYSISLYDICSKLFFSPINIGVDTLDVCAEMHVQ
jgi:hypothetical protein